jgi:hypothetical protein
MLPMGLHLILSVGGLRALPALEDSVLVVMQGLNADDPFGDGLGPEATKPISCDTGSLILPAIAFWVVYDRMTCLAV